MSETPAIVGSAYASASTSIADLAQHAFNAQVLAVDAPNQYEIAAHQGLGDCIQQGGLRQRRPPFRPDQQQVFAQPKEQQQMAQRRIVQVYVVDPNPNVPLDDCILYKGEQKLTDLTDQDLFFEIDDIKGIVARHNEKRTKLVKKEIKDRTEHLEPARISELTMKVVTIVTL